MEEPGVDVQTPVTVHGQNAFTVDPGRGGRPRGRRPEGRLGEDDLGVRVGQDVAHLAGREMPVDRHEVQTRPDRRPVTLEELAAIRQHDRDGVAGVHIHRLQAPTDAVHSGQEIPGDHRGGT